MPWKKIVNDTIPFNDMVIVRRPNEDGTVRVAMAYLAVGDIWRLHDGRTMRDYTEWCEIPDSSAWQKIPAENTIPVAENVAIVGVRNGDGTISVATAYRNDDDRWTLDHGRAMTGATDWCSIPG